jgi:hypothetical protein
MAKDGRPGPNLCDGDLIVDCPPDQMLDGPLFSGRQNQNE